MAKRKAVNPVYPCACDSKACAAHFYAINGHALKRCLEVTTYDGGMCDRCREFQLARVTLGTPEYAAGGAA